MLGNNKQVGTEGKRPTRPTQASNGGIGVLEQRKNGGMERRRRQSKRKEVVGGGLGMDSSADKGAGRKQVHFEGVKGKRLSLKHDRNGFIGGQRGREEIGAF